MTSRESFCVLTMTFHLGCFWQDSCWAFQRVLEYEPTGEDDPAPLVTEYPGVKQKAPPREETVAVCVVEIENAGKPEPQLLLVRRPDKGKYKSYASHSMWFTSPGKFVPLMDLCSLGDSTHETVLPVAHFALFIIGACLHERCDRRLACWFMGISISACGQL